MLPEGSKLLTRSIKLLILLIALISGFIGLQFGLNSLKPQKTYSKDFLAEYLIARAVLERNDPYQPLPALNRNVQPDAPVLNHKSPHTPGLALFFTPFAAFNYMLAAKMWLLAQVLFLTGAVFLLFRRFTASVNPIIVLLVTWAALGWCRVFEDLFYGQLNTLLLLLIVGSWMSLRDGRQCLGGALLGFAISIKLIFWPIAIFLLLRLRWLSVIIVVTVFASINMIAAVIMGWRVVADYYLIVGPSVGSLYRATSQNLSLWSIGWRVFLGTQVQSIREVEAPPVLLSPQLASLTSQLLVGAALLLGLVVSLHTDKNGVTDQAGNFDFAYGIMICVCFLVSPVTWPHYLMLMALPAALIMNKLRGTRYPLRETLLYVIAIIILLIPDSMLQGFILLFKNNTADPFDLSVPFAVGLIRMVPTLSVLILAWLMGQLSGMRNA